MVNGTYSLTAFNEMCHPELRERHLKADKMLQWSILSESPSGCAAKGQKSKKQMLNQVQHDVLHIISVDFLYSMFYN